MLCHAQSNSYFQLWLFKKRNIGLLLFKWLIFIIASPFNGHTSRNGAIAWNIHQLHWLNELKSKIRFHFKSFYICNGKQQQQQQQLIAKVYNEKSPFSLNWRYKTFIDPKIKCNEINRIEMATERMQLRHLENKRCESMRRKRKKRFNSLLATKFRAFPAAFVECIVAGCCGRLQINFMLLTQLIQVFVRI